MRTIKELKAKIETMDLTDSGFAYPQALKDVLGLINEFKEPNDFYDDKIRDKDLDKEEIIEATIKMIKEEIKARITG